MPTRNGQKTPRRSTRSDGESTRRRIFETAGHLFAERGYAYTTSKAICLQAKTNVAAINYHFGSREGLYQALMNEMQNHLLDLDDLRNLAESDLTSTEKLRHMIDLLAANITNQQQWEFRLLTREMLSPSPYLAHWMERAAFPAFGLIDRILCEYTGIPADHPALARCLLSLMAPYLTLQALNREVETPFSPLFDQPVETLAAHWKIFVQAGLDVIAEQYRSDRNNVLKAPV